MKKVILFLAAILPMFVMGGCSEEELPSEPIFDIEIYDGMVRASMDSIHLFRLDIEDTNSYILSKLDRESKDTIWKISTQSPESITVNIGYGEIKTCTPSDPYISMESKGLITIRFRFTEDIYTWALYEYIYSSNNGNLLNKVLFTYPHLPRFGSDKSYVRWNNGDIIIPTSGLGADDNGFLRINSRGEVTEDERGGKGRLEGCLNPCILSEDEYIAYNSQYSDAYLCNLYKGENEGYPIRIDINTYIEEKYPEETNIPKFYIKDVEFKDPMLHFYVSLTFFDGTTKEDEIVIDYNELIDIPQY